MRFPAQHKYSAKRTEVDGITFDSKAEAARYQNLRLLERAGLISHLELQVRYDFAINGVKLGYYLCDFRYVQDGETVVEDVKGMKTPVYRLKAKLMKALYGITVKETA